MLQVAPIDSIAVMKDELRKVARVLDENLSEDIDRAEVEWGMINGALSTLDPHSILLPPVAAKEMDVDNQGEFGGLGIEITVRDGMLTVKSPLEGTPASEAGLKADDQIIRIEDESTINMDLQDAVSKLRGKVGTTVNIMVSRKYFRLRSSSRSLGPRSESIWWMESCWPATLDTFKSSPFCQCVLGTGPVIESFRSRSGVTRPAWVDLGYARQSGRVPQSSGGGGR